MHLLLLTLFALPYVGRTVFWVGVNQVEESSVEYSIAAIRKASESLMSSSDPNAVLWANRAAQFLSRNSRKDSGGSLDDYVTKSQKVYSLLQDASKLVHSDEFLAKRWGHQAKDLSTLFPARMAIRERRVYELLIGWDKGVGYFLLVVMLLLYNIGRAWLTYWVVLLREDEDRSGHSPAWSDYKREYLVHRFVKTLLYVATVSFTFHAWHWLTLPILLPG